MVSLIAMMIFVVTCSAVGLRLLWLATRGGGSPAWSCGLGFTLIALIGHPMSVVSGLGQKQVGEVIHGLAAAGLLFTSAGLAAFFAFTLTAFRMRTPWAWALTIGAILLLAVANFAQIDVLAAAAPEASSAEVTFAWGWVISAVSAVCYGWLGAEGLLEWSKSRRRVALGLTDPVISNRFLMWGLFGVSTTCLSLFLVVLSMYSAAGSRSLTGQVGLTAFGLVSSVAAALAFFPPEAYKRRIRARGAAAAAR